MAEGALRGEGHQWARSTAGPWQDFVQFRLKLRRGRIHLVYRLKQTGRYFIGFDEGGSSLSKQYWPDTFMEGLASSATPHSLGDWHQVEIVGQGARLRFLVDGQVEWEYADPDPLLGGTFAFETLGDTVAYVDDVLVYGPAPTPTPTPDRRFTWVRTGGPLGGLGYDVRMRPDNPDVMYVTDAWAGVHMSTDGGGSWQQTLMGENINAVEFALSNPDIAYAGSSDAVHRSADGGRTWQQVSGGENGWGPPGVRAGFPIDFQVDPRDPDRIFANNYGGGNFLSTDGGRTWTVASKGYTGAQVRDVAVDPAAAGRVFVAARSGLFVSTDGGDEWVGLSYPLAASLEWYVVAVDPTDSQHVLAANNWSGVILQSHDGGWGWRPVSHRPGESMSWRAIAFAPSDPATVYAGTFDDRWMPAGGIYVSHDGGATWTPANDTFSQDANVTGLAVDPRDPQVVYAATGNHGLLKTTDGGQSWTVINQGLPGSPTALSVALHPSAPDVVYAGLERAGLYRSTDGGATWQPSAAGLNPEASVSDIAFAPTDSQVMYAADRFSGVYRSTDGGMAWTPIVVGLRTRAVNALAISADGQHLYAATEGEGVFRLDLSGQPPQPAPTPLLPTPTSVPIATPPPVPTVTPSAVVAALTATPQLIVFPPQPAPEPQAKRGICPGVTVLSLALVGLLLYRNNMGWIQ